MKVSDAQGLAIIAGVAIAGFVVYKTYKAGSTVIDAADGALEGAQLAVTDGIEAVVNTATDALNLAKNAAGDVVDVFGNAIETAGGAVQSAWDYSYNLASVAYAETASFFTGKQQYSPEATDAQYSREWAQQFQAGRDSIFDGKGSFDSYLSQNGNYYINP